MNRGINVLSLFDGISCGKVALERAGIEVNKYYASEIDKHAIKVSKHNHQDIIQLGDVTNWQSWDINWSSIDLIIGGSPCQDFSVSKAYSTQGGEINGLNGEKSKLFYFFLAILNKAKKTNPNIRFLLENVQMKKQSEEQLNTYLNTKGIHINSNLVSYQNRPRIYWANIVGVTKPHDKNVNFQDFKDTDYSYCDQFRVNKTPSRLKMWSDGKGRNSIRSCANVTNSKKIMCLTTKQDRCPNSGLVAHGDFCRYLTSRELELAQTLAPGYTSVLSKNQREKVLGNGWTVDVIAHIFTALKSELSIREVA